MMKNGTLNIGGYTITAELTQDGTLTAQVIDRSTNEVEVEFLADRLTNETIAPVADEADRAKGTARISEAAPVATPTTSGKVEHVQPGESAFTDRPGMQRSRVGPGPE